MNWRSRIGVIGVCVVVPLMAMAWLVYLNVDPKQAIWLLREKGLVERSQVALLLASSVMLIVAAKRVARRGGHRMTSMGLHLIALASFFIAMEEMSWGQKRLGYQVPTWMMSANAQGEMTLHNLNVFQPHRHWLLMLFGIVGIVAVFVRSRFFKSPQRHWIGPLLPERFLLVAFTLGLLSGALLEFVTLTRWDPLGLTSQFGNYWCGQFTEFGELAVATSVAAYSLIRCDPCAPVAPSAKAATGNDS